MTEAPNIRTVHPGRDRSLTIAWKGGEESVVDLSAFLAEYEVFAPLIADELAFQRVDVGDWGWCVRWSEDMEISSDTLFRLALEQGAAWLRDWRRTQHMSETEAAKALGISPRKWRAYEAATQLLPKTVRLAGIGFAALNRAA